MDENGIREYADTEYAAVLIPTMDRYEHFVRCIESLRNNRLADRTHMYVSLDFPKSDKSVKGNRLIDEYLQKGIEGFKEVTIYRQKGNIGARANATFLFDAIRDHHSRYIFTEDDNEFSPCFLEYINKCLDTYESSEEVWAICGYMWPCQVDGIVGNIYKINSIFSAWGYAGWTDKEQKIRDGLNLEELSSIFRDTSVMTALKRDNPFIFTEFVKGYVEYSGCLVESGKVPVIDLSYGIWMYSHGLNAIYPVLSKVRNTGNDGSGANCENLKYDDRIRPNHRNYDYSSQTIDSKCGFDKAIEISKSDKEQLETELRAFLYIPRIELIKTSIVYRLTLLFGRERVRDIIKAIRKTER